MRPSAVRVALGIAYRGSAYSGWQSQPGGRTVQDHVDAAISAFAAAPLKSICAGRTDAGVHARGQVASYRDLRGTRRAKSSSCSIIGLRFRCTRC